MGEASNISLRDESGDPDGYQLELRRLLDGSLVVRICEPGCRAGIAIPAKTTLSDIASALASSAELKIQTRVGVYRFTRRHGWIRLAYCSFDGAWDRSWEIRISDLLTGLATFTRRAA